MTTDFQPALPVPAQSPARLGDILRDQKIIDDLQAENIAKYAQAQDLRFGEAAVALGIVSADAIAEALINQFRRSSATLEARFPGVVALHEKPSQQAQDFRTLAATLKYEWFKPKGRRRRALAVISPERRDGRSTVAANLAVCFANAGTSTLLIDADMRFPRQQELFRLNDRFGLAGYLNGNDRGSVFYTVPGIDNLTVLPVGGPPPDPMDLLMRPTFESLILSSEQHFEVVICDTPAASASSDYQMIAAATGGALLVTRGHRTRVKAAAGMTSACRRLGIDVVGGIFVGGR